MFEQFTNWRKSWHSNPNGECVEVANDAQQVAVRDTENRSGPVLAVPASAWRAFTARLAKD